jgi:NAD(P)-dependent dehydrogenase (short-subunit alcohol dehydrogenase family)
MGRTQGSGQPTYDLTECTAVITGAASGLGQAIAFGFAGHGAAVACADINELGLASTVAQIVAEGGTAMGSRCDVTQVHDVERFFSEVDAAFGAVDVLVNCAFIPPYREHPESFPLDEWETALRVNLTGYFLCSREAGKRMIAAGHGGSVINLSSIAGTSALGRGNLAYSVSKGAINQLTRELAIEWGPHRIRVNAIQPCQFRTPGLQRLIDDPTFDSDALIARFLAGIPLGRLGLPSDIVGPALFLASDASAMVTGVMLPVDGGNLALNAGGSIAW